jgi:hypothetical protein
MALWKASSVVHGGTIRHHQMWTHSIGGMKPQETSRIMTNNLTVTFLTFAAGSTAGLGKVWLILLNGLLWCHRNRVPAGAHVARSVELRLPAWITRAAGYLQRRRSRSAGSGMLIPGLYSRRDSIALAGREAVRLVAGIIPCG